MKEGERPRIAVFAGPTATILNTAEVPREDGKEYLFDRPQRLALSAVLYVDAWSAHPLAFDARDLMKPPDGVLDHSGQFHPYPLDPDETWDLHDAVEVYRIELQAGDRLVSLPYRGGMRGVGIPVWGESGTWIGMTPAVPGERFLQSFFPDAERLYEEIDTFGIDSRGQTGMLSLQANFEFFRVLPPAGYQTEMAARQAGIAGTERRGKDYFPYLPRHLRAEPDSHGLVTVTNKVQEVLDTGRFIGAQWLEGSPTIEETLYWLNLVIDTTVPIVGHSAQRPHGTLGADGDRNIVDGVRYLVSGVWSDSEGRDQVGSVLIVDGGIFASRDVAKVASRPGGYRVTGISGGALGRFDHESGLPRLLVVPTTAHTFHSAVRISQFPDEVYGVQRVNGAIRTVKIKIRNTPRQLSNTARAAVEIVKFSRFSDDCCASSSVESWVTHALEHHPLAGLVAEGQNPFGWMAPSAETALRRAVFCGLPVVKCGRGNTEGVASNQEPWFIRGNDLTATKARILLMACLLRYGSLPPAVDPTKPDIHERQATIKAVKQFQTIFDTH